MARAVEHLTDLKPRRCRATVAARYDSDLIAGAYERAYRRVIAADQMSGRRARSVAPFSDVAVRSRPRAV
jgi:hypothetical protein